MGIIAPVFRLVGKTTVVAAKVGLFVGTVQLTSELGVWGRDPNVAAQRIKTFIDCSCCKADTC